MKDTPDHIRQKQNEIWLAKSPQERVRLGFEMIDDSIKMTRFFIQQQHPEISERDLKVAVFRRFYQNDFSEEELQKIIARF